MADTDVDSSSSENGKVHSDNNESKNNEENCNQSENEKSEIPNSLSDNSEKAENQDTSTENNLNTPPATTVPRSSVSFLRSEGGRINHSSSPLRPSVLGGGCASTSSSSSSSTLLFGSTPICSPVLSSSPNSFPRNLFIKSSLSCSRSSENRSPVFQKPVLRPSQLASPSPADSSSSGSSSSSSATKSLNPFVLNPPKLGNPFAKVNESGDESAKPSSKVESSTIKEDNNPISSSEIQDNIVASSAAGQQGLQSLPLSQQGCPKTPTTSVAFVPLTTPASTTTASTPIRLPTSSATPASAPSNATPGGFVFGQNLHERVIVEPSGSEASTSGSSADSQNSSSVQNDVSTPSTAAAAAAATNGTSTEMLFSSVIQKELPDKTLEGNGSTEDKGKKSLTESAREYEESRAVKRKYEEVTVVTGEEEENNILQMDCKLFVYDGSKFNYSEGVHGSLRVNDPPVTAKKVTQSRVIVRMSGTLRVLMNTKIWAGMKIEKPNRKIVRMTAMDSIGQIKVFLISSSPSESDMLYRVLESRIKLQKELTGACRNGSMEDSDKAGSSQ